MQHKTTINRIANDQDNETQLVIEYEYYPYWKGTRTDPGNPEHLELDTARTLDGTEFILTEDEKDCVENEIWDNMKDAKDANE